MSETDEDKRVPTEPEMHEMLNMLKQHRGSAPELKAQVAAVLNGLKLNPSLLYKTYGHPGKNTPIHFFLFADVEIDAMVSLSDIYASNGNPSTIWSQFNGNGASPLGVACEVGSDEIIQFLVRRSQPECFSQKDCSGKCPIERAIHRPSVVKRLSCTTYRALLNVFSPKEHLDSVISLALDRNFPLDFLEFLVSLYPETMTTFSLGGKRSVVTLQQMQILGQLIPRVTEQLDMSGRILDCDAFVHTMKVLCDEAPKSLSLLGIRLQIEEFLDNGNQRLDKVFSCLQQSLESTLCFQGASLYVASAFGLLPLLISAIFKGVAANQGITDMIIDHGSLGVSFFLCVGERRLTLNDRALASHNTSHNIQQMIDQWKPHDILVHSSCGSSSALLMSALLYAPSNLVSLKCTGQVNVESLLQAVKSNSSLEYLNVKPFRDDSEAVVVDLSTILYAPSNLGFLLYSGRVNMESLLEALKSNNTRLERLVLDPSYGKKYSKAILEVLQYHNVTLWECKPWEEESRIEFYLDLNRMGRAKVRQIGFDGEAMVALLRQAQDRRGLITRKGFDRLQSVLYGLLREAPAFWSGRDVTTCHPVASRKRKKCPA